MVTLVKALEDRYAQGKRDQMREAAFRTNYDGQIATQGQSDTPAGDLITRALEALGASGKTAYDLGQKSETLADMTGYGTLKALDKGDFEGAAMAVVGGPAKRLTFKHPISGVKLKTPIEEMNPTYKPRGEMLPEKPLHPQDLFGGTVIPMRGDPTISGKTLTGVGGKEFETPVDLFGGPNFPRQKEFAGSGWASNASPSSILGNRAASLAEDGDPVFGAYMKMSPTSGDYSTMMTETLNQMIKQGMPEREAIDAFNNAMRADWGSQNKKTGKFEFPGLPDFPGVENLSTEWINSAGKGRTKLAQLMDQKKFQDMGFPQPGVARHAITEPELLNTPTNTSGHSVIRFDPSGKVIKDPLVKHPTYAQHNVGTYEGRMPELPLEVLYGEDVMKGVNPSHVSKILETKPPSVKVDQQTLDRVMKYLRSQDGSKWGLGGAVTAGLLSAEQAREMEQNNAL